MVAAAKQYYRERTQGFADQAVPWQVELVVRFGKLTQLDHDWDSYGALPVDDEALIRMLALALSVMAPDTPMPHVVPVSDGGVQIEWHENGIDLEMCYDTDSEEVDVFMNGPGVEGFVGLVQPDDARLRGWVELLAG